MARDSVTSYDHRKHRKISALLMSPSQVLSARDLQSIFRHTQQSWTSGRSRFSPAVGDDRIKISMTTFACRAEKFTNTNTMSSSDTL